jgi:hypothetical protein
MRLLFVLATVVAAPVWVGEYYYLVRANALEHNVVLYKTVGGKRSSLQVKGRMFGYGVGHICAQQQVEQSARRVRRSAVHGFFQRQQTLRS